MYQMKANSTDAAQNTKETYMNRPHRLSSDPDTIAKHIMCLDGAWEAWLDMMEDGVQLSMQNENPG